MGEVKMADKVTAHKRNPNKDSMIRDTRVQFAQALIRRAEDLFYCRHKRRKVPLGKCLDDYLMANAFNRGKSVCHRCPQGKKNREEYAEA